MKIIGWVEESVCDCCGRGDLKRALAVRTDEGEVLKFGSDCARRHLGMASIPLMKAAVRAEGERVKALREAYHAAAHATEAMRESVRLTEEAVRARIPFSQRPARIKEARVEAFRVAAQQFTPADLADIERYGNNPSAYAS